MQVMLYDKDGRGVYGAHVPLQILGLGEDAFLYFTGYKDEHDQVVRSDIPFPSPPENILFALDVEYVPSPAKECDGTVHLLVYPLDDDGNPDHEKSLAEGSVSIGQKLTYGEYALNVEEVLYWVGMMVLSEPGKPFVLTFLWVGFSGMVIVTIGRMLRKSVPK